MPLSGHKGFQYPELSICPTVASQRMGADGPGGVHRAGMHWWLALWCIRRLHYHTGASLCARPSTWLTIAMSLPLRYNDATTK